MKNNKKISKDLIARLSIFFLVSIAIMLFVIDFQKPNIPGDSISQICAEINSLDER